jgi:hypothetical protein
MTPRRLAGLGALTALACAREPPPPAASPGETQPLAADSLVLRSADGFEVWLTDARAARDSAGEPCLERSVEIRNESTRMRVPLLYTRSAPTRLDRGHIRAVLSLDCRPTAAYSVELATARPTKIADR